MIEDSELYWFFRESMVKGDQINEKDLSLIFGKCGGVKAKQIKWGDLHLNVKCRCQCEEEECLKKK